MYFREKTSGGRAYLQIVESPRDGDQVRQQVIATLGRIDELQASGQLERLLRSGARFATQAMVLGSVANDTATRIAVRRVGPTLVFERLRAETGCQSVITALDTGRNHRFALERAVFLRVPHRLMGGGRIWRRSAGARTTGSPVPHRCPTRRAAALEVRHAAAIPGTGPVRHRRPEWWPAHARNVASSQARDSLTDHTPVAGRRK